jgi:hypothetical protein
MLARMTRSLCLGALLILTLSAHCKPKEDADKAVPEDEPTPADSPQWSEQSRAWVNGMRAAMPNAMCEEKMFFRQCFSVDEAQCKSRFKRLLEKCLKENPSAVPKVVNAETGGAGGQVLGTCMGSTYEIELKKAGQRTDSPKCNDVSNWVPR